MAGGYPKALAAATSASEAVHLIILAIHEEDAIQPDVLLKLVDAARLIVECTGTDPADGQLQGALVKWLEEQGEVVDG